MQYQIQGTPLPVVICNLEPNETMICESGSMSWMSPNMQLKTQAGGFGKAMGRMFSGESLFLNHYTPSNGTGMIAFASSFPGSIRAFQITPQQSIICQKSAFLASESTVELSVHFQKKLRRGIYHATIVRIRHRIHRNRWSRGRVRLGARTADGD